MPALAFSSPNVLLVSGDTFGSDRDENARIAAQLANSYGFAGRSGGCEEL
jgi:hypothetical protein